MQGVYKITNINNNEVYIGSSKNIERRWKEHLEDLKAGVHHSYKLQKCYNSLKDKNDLKFEVLVEVTNEDDLIDLEQFYYNKYDSYRHGYNCCRYADNPKYSDKQNPLSEEFEYLVEQITTRMKADERKTKSDKNNRATSRTYYCGKLSAFEIVLKLIKEFKHDPTK